jgi:hypothetical protein
MNFLVHHQSIESINKRLVKDVAVKLSELSTQKSSGRPTTASEN